MSWTEVWRRVEVIANRTVARGTQLTTLRVTKEGFFNWNAEADPTRVAALASTFRSRS